MPLQLVEHQTVIPSTLTSNVEGGTHRSGKSDLDRRLSQPFCAADGVDEVVPL